MPSANTLRYVNGYAKAPRKDVAIEAVGTSVNADAYVVKYASTGVPLWAARVGTTGAETNIIMATPDTDSAGNVYVPVSTGAAPVSAYNSDGTAFGTVLPVIGGADICLIKYNSGGIVQWMARIGTSSGDLAAGLAVDSSGNIYICGQGANAVPIIAYNADGTSSGQPSQANQGSNDSFLIKYNSSGVVQWGTIIASTQADRAYAIDTDSSGNVYITGQGGSGVSVTGYSTGSLVGGITLPNSGLNDAFVFKYNSSGTVQWGARFASTAADNGFSLNVDSNGDVYVAGNGGSGATVTVFNSSGAAFATTLPSAGGLDATIVKFNSSGGVLWVARVASTLDDQGYGITTDGSGNVYVTGQYSGTLTAYSSNGVAFGSTVANAGSTDAFLVKYNSTGTVQWLTRVSSTGADIGYSVGTDTSGNVYMTGQSGAVTTITVFNAGGGTFGTLTNTTGVTSPTVDAFLIKYNSSGTAQFAVKLASTGADIGRGLTVDTNGFVYTTGTYTGSRFAIYGQALSLFSSLSISGTSDAFIVNYNRTGLPQWVAKIASSATDIGYASAVDSSGNIYIVGQGGSAAVVTAFNADGTSFGTTIANAGLTDAFLVKYNTSGVVQWVARIASTGNDLGLTVKTDPSGNVYVAGQGGSGAVVTAYSSNGSAFGTTIANAGGTDAFLVKYDTTGAVQWVARVASTGDDIGYRIDVDSSGNVYMCGQGGSGAVVTSFSSNGVAFGTTLPNAGGNDAFVVKYDTSGTVQWNARLASTATDIAYGIAVDSSGNVYVTGQCGSGAIVTVYNANGTTFQTIPAGTGTSVFVVKYDTNGTGQWRARLDSNTNDIGYAVAVDPSGNVYATGVYLGTLSVFNSDATLYITLAAAGVNTDTYVVKYSPEGRVQWATRIVSSGVDTPASIAADSYGNVYVAGIFGSDSQPTVVYNSNGSIYATISGSYALVVFDTGGNGKWVQRMRGVTRANDVCVNRMGDVCVTGQSGTGTMVVFETDITPYTFINAVGAQDAFLIKYSSTTYPMWAALISSVSTDVAYAVATDSSGNAYVTGSYNNPLTLYNADGTAFATTLPQVALGQLETFIVKYSPGGRVQWAARITSTGSDVGYGIATDTNGDVYVTGQSGGVLTIYNSDGTTFGTLADAGSGDAFVVKYNTNGAAQWRARIASTAGGDIGFAITTNSSNSVFVTGSFGSAATATVFNASGTSVATLINTGERDLFIVCYTSAGGYSWAARIDSSAADIGYAITTNPATGGIYVTGTMGTLNASIAVRNAIGSTPATFGTRTGLGGGDAVIVSYNSSGIAQWMARVASAGDDIGYSAAADSSGNLYVAGSWAGITLTCYNANGTAFSPTRTPSGGGSVADAYIVKYNSSGSVQWVAQMGFTNPDIAYACAVDSSGDAYVAGQATASTFVQAYSADGTLFGSSATAVVGPFIVKYNSSGTVQWISNIGGVSSTTNNFRGIALDSSSNLFAVGQFGTGMLIPAST